MKKHAFTAGLGAPARLRSTDVSNVYAATAGSHQRKDYLQLVHDTQSTAAIPATDLKRLETQALAHSPSGEVSQLPPSLAIPLGRSA